ncbi:unnamed protein product [Discula destructiva]
MSHERNRSTSRSRVSRPTTPLRPSSRSSFPDSAGASADAPFPLNAFEPQFGELSDAMADLEANLMHFQLMHESLARFSESFASFLYGLNMNAFCVDYPEAPIPESFRRARQGEDQEDVTVIPDSKTADDLDGEMTFMTTDTSFVENPSSANLAASRFQTPVPRPRASRAPAPSTRGGPQARGGRGGTRGTRGTRASGLAPPRVRGLR